MLSGQGGAPTKFKSKRCHVSNEFDDAFEDVQKNPGRRAVGVDAADGFAAVKFEHGPGFLLVNVQPVADDLEVRIVQPVFLDGAASPTVT